MMLFCMSKIFIFLIGLMWYCMVSAEPLWLKNDTNAHLFDVEIADTPEKSQLGLMFREHLDDDKGMLFVLPQKHPLYMWMKNTYISLDMLFFDTDGKIVKIIPNTTPFSEQILPSEISVAGVLEVNAGIAQKLNIQVGDYIVNDRLK